MYIDDEKYETINKLMDGYKNVIEIQEQLLEIKTKMIENQETQIECLERLLAVVEVGND